MSPVPKYGSVCVRGKKYPRDRGIAVKHVNTLSVQSGMTKTDNLVCLEDLIYRGEIVEVENDGVLRINRVSHVKHGGPTAVAPGIAAKPRTNPQPVRRGGQGGVRRPEPREETYPYDNESFVSGGSYEDEGYMSGEF